MVAAYQAGATVYVVAEQFGLHRDRVSRLVKAAGVRVRDHERTEVDLDQVAELKRQGLNLYKIAEIMGVGRTTIIKARQRARKEQS